MLSEYQIKIIEDNKFSLAKTKKLIPNLGNKRKYQLHYQNLKIYLKLQYQNSNKNHFQNHTSNAIQICKEKHKEKVTKSKAKCKFKSIENPVNKVDVKIATTRKQYLN